MLLVTHTQKIHATLAAAATTTDPTFHATYADITPFTFTPGANNGSFNGETAAEVVDVPDDGVSRSIKELIFYNPDTVAHTIAVQLKDSAAATLTLGSFSVAKNTFLRYSQETGWQQGATGYLPIAGGTMTGNIGMPNASAPSPALAFNTNYGLFYDTTNNGVAISVNGSEIAWFGTSGIALNLNDAGTAVIADVADWRHTTSGTAAANFGVGNTWTIENASGANVLAARTAARWLAAAAGSEASEFVISTMNAGALAEKVRVTAFGYVVSPSNTRTTADFNKTNVNLSNITGLSVNVAAGKTYPFEAVLFYSTDSSGPGHKYAVGGTATATAITYHVLSMQDHATAPSIVISSTLTSLASPASAAGTSTAGKTVISGTITVNGAGTLTVQFAEKTAVGTATIKQGSTFIVWEID